MNNLRNHWKSKVKWVLPVVIVLAAFALGWWMSGDDRHDHETVSTIEQTTSGNGDLQLYTCAMHPQVRSPNPNDKCPICGMELIPVPVDEDMGDDGDLPRLRVTPRAAALMQVEVRPVEARQVAIPVRLYGRIGYDETRLSTISAWMGGRLDRLYVDFTGTAVRKGQPMVEIYSPTLITAQEEHLQTIQTAGQLEKSGLASVRDVTRMTVSASRDRLRLLGLDEDQVKRLEQQGRVDDKLIIPAPSSGIVIERLAATGDYLETGQPIYRLADLSHLWVQLEVYQSELQWLEVGQQAIFTTQSYPGERFEGKTTFIDPVVNEATRTVRVRVELPNPDFRLKPGMYVRGMIEGSQAQAQPQDAGHDHDGLSDDDLWLAAERAENDLPLVIPVSAPLITGERAVVYVQKPLAEQPTFEPRDIVLGPRAGPWQIVREGLIAGELVVTRGAFKIDSELQIRGQPSMMQPLGGPPPVHDHGETVAPPAAPAPQPVFVPEPFQVQIGGIVIANFAIVDALASDDADAARQAAFQVDAALHRADATVLKEDADRRVWNSLAGELHHSLAGMAEAGALEAQREYFKSFSRALIETVRTFGLAQSGQVYLVKCIMVANDEGYWLQMEETITNPYYGGKMVTCGEVVEILVETDDLQGGDR